MTQLTSTRSKSSKVPIALHVILFYIIYEKNISMLSFKYVKYSFLFCIATADFAEEAKASVFRGYDKDLRPRCPPSDVTNLTLDVAVRQVLDVVRTAPDYIVVNIRITLFTVKIEPFEVSSPKCYINSGAWPYKVTPNINQALH